MKRLCLLMAALLLWVSAGSALAEASGGISGGGFEYILLDDGTAEITYWDGDGKAELEVPEAIDGHAVTSVGDYAVSCWESLVRVTLPECVARIGDGAFEGCESLETVVANGVRELGSNPFVDCPALSRLTLPDDRFSLADGMLIDAADGRLIGCLGDAAESLAVPEGVKVIGENAFYGCAGIRSVDLPEGVTAIEDGTFSMCGALETINLPDSLTGIGKSAFMGCLSLRSVDLPAGVAEIPAEAFGGCEGLEAVRLPAGLKRIGSDAFAGCESLGSIDLPEGLEAIGGRAFAFCMSLEDVALPASLGEMGVNPFMDCASLAALRVPADHAWLKVVDGVLFTEGGGRLACYPQALEADTYAIPEGTTSVGAFAFFYCNRLVSVSVPDSVTDIAPNAFAGRENLTLIVGRDSCAEAYAKANLLKYTYPGADDWLNG